MKEKKFRAWDIDNKAWIYSDHLPGLLWFFDMLENGDFRYDLLEYTGLKDKNGKSIYEGDIISLNEDSSYEVVWYQGDFQIGWKKKSGDYLTDIGKEFVNKFEIIGTIYENPELLN